MAKKKYKWKWKEKRTTNPRTGARLEKKTLFFYCFAVNHETIFTQNIMAGKQRQ